MKQLIFLFCLLQFFAKAQEVTLPLAVGKVSHEYKKTGCSTVVVIDQAPQLPLVLIPREPLPKKYDKNGLIITFQYRTLHTPNPVGCIKGIPAELKDVRKK